MKNKMLIKMIAFAKARKKQGFTHHEFNMQHETTCSTARLSDLRSMGYVFRESVQNNGRKRFWLVKEGVKI